MFENFFKIAIRNLSRNKVISLINIIGLSVGMACFLLIGIWVFDELSYDRFHPEADRLYRVVVDYEVPGGVQDYAVSAAVMPRTMREEIPEIELGTAMSFNGMTIRNPQQNVPFIERTVCFAEPVAFEMFGFEFLKGDPETALSTPNSVVITEEIAEKYFGDSDPIGQTLIMNGRPLSVPDEREYRVTGLLKNLPENTHIQRNIFCSFATLELFAERQINHWGWLFFYGYVRLKEGVSPALVESKFPELLTRHADPRDAEGATIRLQPVTDIHLYSDRMFDGQNGDMSNVYLFSAVALLIILIACINFMNLSTARSVKRSKEVGVKKVLGARRKQLITQFLSEAIIAGSLAVVISLVLVELALPVFNELSQKNLTLPWSNIWLIIGLPTLAILVGVLSGIYPAFFLSAFKPVNVLKNTRSLSSGGGLLRKGLIIFQFSVSVILIIGTAIVHSQLDYFKNKKLGFEQDQIVTVGMPANLEETRFNALENELKSFSGIDAVIRASSIPGGNTIQFGYTSQQNPDAKPGFMSTYSVDYNFIDLLSLEIIEGRKFREDFGTDTSAFVINETAARDLGFETPHQAIGEELSMEEGKSGTIIGVMKNFHYSSLRQPIGPLVMHISPRRYTLVALKLRANEVEEALAHLETTYRSFFPDRAFSFTFLDERIERQYLEENRLGSIFGYFSFLAIFIACLGLFGLASFTTEQRTKEVGIRKVLGASQFSLLQLLTKEFLILVSIANLIAWPVAWLIMNRWLENFAYRTDMGWGIFLVAGALALIIALATVSWQAIKVSLANPVSALRHE